MANKIRDRKKIRKIGNELRESLNPNGYQNRTSGELQLEEVRQEVLQIQDDVKDLKVLIIRIEKKINYISKRQR